MTASKNDEFALSVPEMFCAFCVLCSPNMNCIRVCYSLAYLLANKQNDLHPPNYYNLAKRWPIEKLNKVES